MPELRLVVLALQDKLAYGPTFEAALASLFGGETSSLSATESAQPAPQAGTQLHPHRNQRRSDRPKRAHRGGGQDFADYQRLTAEGKLGEAGQKLDQLKHVLDQLNAQKK